MNLQLNRKIFIVTGGNRGIGFEIVRVLLDENAFVVVADRSNDNLEKICSRSGSVDNALKFFKLNLLDDEQVQNLVDYTIERYGRIDGVINNAGINDLVGLDNNSVQDFVDSYFKNVVHFYSLVQKSLPFLKETTGCIINIGSKVAITGQGFTSGYAASKGAINGLTREWAADLAKYNIRVNCVCPAEVYTPMYEEFIRNRELSYNEAVEKIVSRIPLGQRFTKASEIANMVVFLSSNFVSGHTTGQILYVDGGYTHLDRALP